MQQISENTWSVDTELRMPGGLIFPLRMTVIRFDDGRLALHSPVRLGEAEIAAIEALGEVRYIIAPNAWHHLYVGAASRAFPEATMVGSEAVARKRSDLPFAGTLSDLPNDWPAVLRPIPVDGAPKVDEWVFHHQSDRVFLCSDLLFNIHEIPNLRTDLVLRIIGAHRKLTPSASWRWLFVKNRPAFERSVRELLSLDVEKVVMGHGEVVTEDGAAALAKALRYYGQGAPLLTVSA